jgi:hypothetical protein
LVRNGSCKCGGHRGPPCGQFAVHKWHPPSAMLVVSWSVTTVLLAVSEFQPPVKTSPHNSETRQTVKGSLRPYEVVQQRGFLLFQPRLPYRPPTSWCRGSWRDTSHNASARCLIPGTPLRSGARGCVLRSGVLQVTSRTPVGLPRACRFFFFFLLSAASLASAARLSLLYPDIDAGKSRMLG